MFINVFTRKTLRLLIVSVLFVYILNINAFQLEDEEDEFIDIGVRLTGDNKDSLIADLIAEERDVINAGLIDGVDVYHFRVRRKRSHRSKRAIDETIEDLKRDDRIQSITIGETVEREKREYIEEEDDEEHHNIYRRHIQFDDGDKSKFKMPFNDELYHKQWYLENEGQFNTPPNHDLNPVQSWRAGYTGAGVSICIIDDGLDHRHPDIHSRYRPDLSYDLNDLNDTAHDPLPRTFDSQNSHGTRCAGAAAGEANNGMCGVGVAYGADIAGIRLLDGRITTLLESRALTLFAEKTHIKSASWGPRDDGTKMEAPGRIVNVAMDYAIQKGRFGKGIIFVWASGNGGRSGDDCGADGYASHPYVISINSINHEGKTANFGEFCPGTMAVAYTGGRHKTSGFEENLPVGIVAADVAGKCTTNFFGTSAAAPVAAGAFALVLEANPELTYRDLMYIVARTARIPTLAETDGWLINGAGYHVNDKFGFGVLDSGQMTALAQNWTLVHARYECYLEYKGGPKQLITGGTIEVPIDLDKCEGVTMIEHVVANVSYSFHRRGDVKITLISPSKTPSEMLSYRKNDATNKGIKYFPFLSTHHWGENPIGRWKLQLETLKPKNMEAKRSSSLYGEASELGHFGLRIYGTHDPNQTHTVDIQKRQYREAFVPTQNEIESMYKREIAARETPHLMQKRDYQNLLRTRSLPQPTENENEDLTLFGLFRRAFGF